MRRRNALGAQGSEVIAEAAETSERIDDIRKLRKMVRAKLKFTEHYGTSASMCPRCLLISVDKDNAEDMRRVLALCPDPGYCPDFEKRSF